MIQPTMTANDWRSNETARAWLHSVLSEPLGRELMAVLLDFASAPRTLPLDATYALGSIHGRREVYNLLIAMTTPPDKKKSDVKAGYERQEKQEKTQ